MVAISRAPGPDARQDGNYEIYFNATISRGQKLGPDLRVTQAPKFSIDPVIAWNGRESILVWDDRRSERRPGDDDVRLFGQRIALDGSLLGGNVALTGAGTLAENPGIALGQARVGIVFSARLPNQLTHGEIFHHSAGLDTTKLARRFGRYRRAEPELGLRRRALRGVLGTARQQLWSVDLRRHRRRKRQPAEDSARRHQWCHLCTQFLGAFVGRSRDLGVADDHDGNYELYLQILDGDLNVLSPRTRLSFTTSDTLSPVATWVRTATSACCTTTGRAVTGSRTFWA